MPICSVFDVKRCFLSETCGSNAVLCTNLSQKYIAPKWLPQHSSACIRALLFDDIEYNGHCFESLKQTKNDSVEEIDLRKIVDQAFGFFQHYIYPCFNTASSASFYRGLILFPHFPFQCITPTSTTAPVRSALKHPL